MAQDHKCLPFDWRARPAIIYQQTPDGLSYLKDRLLMAIQALLKKEDLKLDVYFDNQGRINLTHQEYGSKNTFSVISSTGGFLSQRPNVPTRIENGIDIQGTIGGELAQGDGQFLTGMEGTGVDGLP
jgi:hypothetical protein